MVKQHADGEGGNFLTIYVPSLKRERQTVMERLDMTPDTVEAVEEVCH